MAFRERVYNSEQRAAIVEAYAQPGVTARRVAELSAAGELPAPDGSPLEPFEVPQDTVRDFARKARRSAARPSPLVALPAQDAVEALRQRLVKVAEAEIRALEALPEGKRDLDRARQAGKVLEQLSKVPGPSAPRPASRSRGGGGQPGGQAGALLTDHRAAPALPSPTPEPELPKVGVEPEPEPRELSIEERRAAAMQEFAAGLRSRFGFEREQLDEQPPGSEPAGDSRAERRRRRGPQEDVSSWR